MKPCRRNIGHVATLAVALVAVMGMTVAGAGQEVPGQRAALIDDWTHHHLVFSNPGTEADAVKNGRYEHWYNVTHDPRYRLQQLKRRHAQQTVAPAAAAAPADFASRLATAMAGKPASKPKGNPISKDWSVDLNGPSATGTITNSNAGSTSSVTISTTTLGVVNPTAQVVHLSFSSTPANTSSLQIGTVVYDFTTSSISSTPPSSPICNVYVSGTNVTNLYDAITVSGTAGATTYRCYTGAAANSAVTSLSEHSSSTIIYMTAVTPGSTGITYSTTGSPNITWSISTAGTDGTSSGTGWAYWSGAGEAPDATVAANIAYSINNNTTLKTQVSAVATGTKILVTALTEGASYVVTKTNFSALSWSPTSTTGGAQSTVQPNTYPAKYGASLTSASCGDFIIYPTGMTGSSSAASIVAYDNLYSSCSSDGTVPSEDWAYNTGGAVTTSPVLSLDGSQVAYVQSNGTTASLVLLKWAANSGTLTAPATITSESASTYRGCSAPCYVSLALSGSPNDTFSAPFADYDNDIIYVGDDSGSLHQFTGVFQGTPAESTSPWPVHLGANKLSSPVYDSATGFEGGYIFVGDMGGVFYSVGSGYGGTASGTIYGNTGSLGNAIADAPLVDSWEGTEFVFVTTNGSYSWTGYDGVWEFVSVFTDLGTPGVVPVGVGGAGYYLYAGAFDNVYFDSGNPAAGNIYVVGNTGVAGGATLYQVKIAYSSLTGVVNSVATGLNSTEYPWPSPVAEFCNNGANPCSLSQRTAVGSLSTSSPNVTLTSGTFTSADVGAQIWASPSNILYGDTITTVLSSTTANLEFAPSQAESGQTFTIQDGITTSGTDYIFFSVNRGTGSGCTSTYGNGCVLAYNVTNPTSVSQAGTGLNVKTPGTSNTSAGCWATGGIAVDNSDTTTTGASQIYFLNLNGIAAGGPVSGTKTSSSCTSGTATNVLNAVQASQSNP
jgi:hypothetical protein